MQTDQIIVLGFKNKRWAYSSPDTFTNNDCLYNERAAAKEPKELFIKNTGLC